MEVRGKTEERTPWRRHNESLRGREEKKNSRLVGGETRGEVAEWLNF